MSTPADSPLGFVVPVIDVHQRNFKTVWPVITKAIETATFIAVDVELSGLGNRNALQAKSIDDRYKIVVEVAKSMAILSFGLSCFRYKLESSESARYRVYEVQTFEITLLCSEPYTVEPDSLRFLREKGFDFNKQCALGVPYHRGNDLEKEISNASPKERTIRNLFSIIVKSQKSLVLHNGFIDIIFLYHHFYLEAPTKMQTFLANLHEMFWGGIFDTKYIVEYKLRHKVTFLEYVFRKMQRNTIKNDQLQMTMRFPRSESIARFVETRDLQFPECDTLAPEQICQHFAYRGWCAFGNGCHLSHDVCAILWSTESHQKQNRRKSLKRKKEDRSMIDARSHIKSGQQVHHKVARTPSYDTVSTTVDYVLPGVIPIPLGSGCVAHTSQRYDEAMATPFHYAPLTSPSCDGVATQFHDAVLASPSYNETIETPLQAEDVAMSACCETIAMPSHYEPIASPSRNAAMSTPSRNETMSTPSRNETMSTPSCNETMSTPSCNETMSTPSCNETMSTPSCNETMSTPSCNETMSTPSYNATTSTPSRDETIGTPSRDEAIGTPSRDEAIATPSRDETIASRSHETIATPSCYENTASTPSHEETSPTPFREKAIASDCCNEILATPSPTETIETPSPTETIVTPSHDEAIATPSHEGTILTLSHDSRVEPVATESCTEAVATESCTEAVANESCTEAVANESCTEAVANESCSEAVATESPKETEATTVKSCDEAAATETLKETETIATQPHDEAVTLSDEAAAKPSPVEPQQNLLASDEQTVELGDTALPNVLLCAKCNAPLVNNTNYNLAGSSNVQIENKFVQGNASLPSVDSAQTDYSKQSAKSIAHRAGYDAFMTGYIMATYLENFKMPSLYLTPLKFLDSCNNVHLCGKDFPLPIQKSEYARTSMNHKKKFGSINE